MNRIIKFQAIAEAELNDAVANNPLQYPLLQSEVRYLNTHRFPYRIYFQTEAKRRQA
jgi:hypothetical protein